MPVAAPTMSGMFDTVDEVTGGGAVDGVAGGDGTGGEGTGGEGIGGEGIGGEGGGGEGPGTSGGGAGRQSAAHIVLHSKGKPSLVHIASS